MKKYKTKEIGIITRINRVIQKYVPELFNEDNEDTLHDIYVYALEFPRQAQYENQIIDNIILKIMDRNYNKRLIHDSLFDDIDIANLVIEYHEYPNELLDIIVKILYEYINDDTTRNSSIDRKIREVDLLINYFGIFGNPNNYTELGNLYGISASRARYIVTNFLIKLRYPSRKKLLKDYYYDSPYEIKTIDEI